MPPQMLEHTTSLLIDSLGENRDDRRVKCVLVGDGAIGKTSLIVSYTTNGYPTEYVPTAFDNYSVSVKVDDKPIRLQLCDTAGQDDFDSLRPLCYPHTDVFLLCFSVVSPTSFHNVLDKWVPEIKKHCRSAPVILVGTQSDLRSNVKILIELANYREQPINENEAKLLAQQMGAQAYVECSALTQKNLKEVFDTAILAALEASGQLSKLCNTTTNNNNTKTKSKKDKGHSKSAKSATEKAQRLSAASIKKGWKKFCCFL